MKVKKIYLIIGMLLSVFTTFYSCSSQSNKDNAQILQMKETTTGNGIELDSKATVIHRDKNENIWFASEKNGIYRYDGENLVLYNSEVGLKNYRIISVQEDNVGNLYFDTPEDVYKYNGDKFDALSVVDSKESENEWKSEPGDLWFRIGWDKRGPYRYDGENLYQLKFPKNILEDEFYIKYPNASVNPYAIFSVYNDSKGNIWFGTAYLGIYLFDGNEISWMYENQLSETPGGGDFGIRSIIEDEVGHYWICNANYKYTLFSNVSGRGGLKTINYKRQVGIEKKVKDDLYFYSMETDNNGDLLMFAKEYGLWLNNGKDLTQFFIKDGELNISPTSMYKDNKGTFWFGTDKYGIYKYNGSIFEKLIIK